MTAVTDAALATESDVTPIAPLQRARFFAAARLARKVPGFVAYLHGGFKNGVALGPDASLCETDNNERNLEIITLATIARFLVLYGRATTTTPAWASPAQRSMRSSLTSGRPRPAVARVTTSLGSLTWTWSGRYASRPRSQSESRSRRPGASLLSLHARVPVLPPRDRTVRPPSLGGRRRNRSGERASGHSAPW